MSIAIKKMMVKEETKKRFEWMDVLRGLLIISVVIGHSTGKFNGYIYQFHMGAFFLVSGYLAKQKSRSLLETIYHKVLTLFLPVLTSVCILQLVVYGLHRLNIYNMLLGDMQYITLGIVLKEFFLHGTIYVWWLGAAWFVLVLFLISIIHRALYQLVDEKYGVVYGILSICLFLIGYLISKTGAHAWNIDLVLIAQVYYVIGLYLYKYAENVVQKRTWMQAIVLACITFVIMHIIATKLHFTMDYPSRAFNAPAIDIFMVVNGAIFIYALAMCISKIPFINQVTAYLGRNTLPILLFHFMAFKISFYCLYKFGLIPFQDISVFVPSDEVGEKYWWFIALIAILVSLLIWVIITHIPILNVLFGQDKTLYKLWYNKLSCNAIWTKIDRQISKIKLPSLAEQQIVRMGTIIAKFHPIMILCLAAMVLVGIPIAMQGVILNDEVQMLQNRAQGIGHLVSHNINAELQMGRPLRIMAAINASLSFLFSNMTASRVFQVVIIFVAILSFGYFAWKLLRNIKFSVFVCAFILAFMPITFEHATPNAFNGLVYVPMIELFISLSLFCSYLEQKNKKYIVWSAVLFIISLLGYEFMVTFILLYPLVYIYKRVKGFEIRRILKIFAPVAIFGIAYVAVLYLSSIIMHGSYDGAKFGFVSFRSSMTILINLFCSAIPGYWLTNKKYQYLYSVYGDLSALSVRAIILGIVICTILTYTRLHKTNEQKKTYGNVGFGGMVLIGLLFSFLPASANAVSSIYQGAVTSENFTSLPVTSFLYISVCFTICLILWKLFDKIRNKYAICAICIIIACCSMPVQAMNDTFAKEQHANFERLMSVDNIFATNTAKNLKYQIVYAEDLYKTHNALSIQEGYFDTIAASNGIEGISFVTDKTQPCSIMIFESGINQWTISSGDEAVILSEYRLTGMQTVRLDYDVCEYVEVADQGKDGDFYYYHFKKNQDGKLVISQEEPFADIVRTAGSTLAAANIEYGIYQDGWVAPETKLQIASGSTGVINLMGTYTQEIKGDEVISIYQDQTLLTQYPVTGQDIEIEIPCHSDTVAELMIKCNFSFAAEPPDVRELSFQIDDIIVE